MCRNRLGKQIYSFLLFFVCDLSGESAKVLVLVTFLQNISVLHELSSLHAPTSFSANCSSFKPNLYPSPPLLHEMTSTDCSIDPQHLPAQIIATELLQANPRRVLLCVAMGGRALLVSGHRVWTSLPLKNGRGFALKTRQQW